MRWLGFWFYIKKKKSIKDKSLTFFNILQLMEAELLQK